MPWLSTGTMTGTTETDLLVIVCVVAFALWLFSLGPDDPPPDRPPRLRRPL